jgi:hypothetical protein
MFFQPSAHTHRPKERSGGDGDGAVEQQKGGSETMSKLHSAHSFLFTQAL